MTIQEAIKSGKRFRRKGQREWYEQSNNLFSSHNCFSQREILAEDWEIKPEPLKLEAFVQWNEFEHTTLMYPHCVSGDLRALRGKRGIMTFVEEEGS